MQDKVPTSGIIHEYFFMHKKYTTNRLTSSPPVRIIPKNDVQWYLPSAIEDTFTKLIKGPTIILICIKDNKRLHKLSNVTIQKVCVPARKAPQLSVK